MKHRPSIGLDVHARSVSAAAFVPETGEIVSRTFGYDPASIAAWAACECQGNFPPGQFLLNKNSARADVREDLMADRNRLSKMLLRKGLVYPGKSA